MRSRVGGLFHFQKGSMDTLESTDVGNESSVATAEESTSAAASTVSQEDTNQTTASGNDTAQSVIEAQESDTAGTVDPTQDDDPLKDVPSLEELEQNKSQQYAQALINLRTAYEARKEENGTLKSQFEPVQPLLEQHGGVEAVQARLEAYNSLFTPVVNEQTHEVERDEQGLPVITTTPFITQVDSENPGMAEQMLSDLLRYQPENGTPLWQSTLKAFGLDPAKLNDYRNIDALAAPSTGEITPEQLEAIPENQQEAFKTLPASLRAAWKEIPEDEQKYHIEGAQERIEAKRHRESETQRIAAEQQNQIAAAREQITTAQNEFVSSQLQESYATIMDDVAKQVTFSADPNENSQMLGITGAFIFALRDPDYSSLAEKTLASFGTKLDPSFHEALSVADKHMRDYKTYEMVGQKGLAQTSLTKANAAKTQVIAKLAPLALKVAKALGGQQAQRANQQNGLLGTATSVRPTPGNGTTQAEPNGYLPAGMLANDPRAGIEIAKRTGLLG